MDPGEVVSLLIILGGLYAMVGFMTQVLSSNNTRRKLGEQSLSPEQIEALMRGATDVPGSLRMGIVTIAVGLGLVAVQFFPEDMRDQPIVFGVIFLFAGVAFLLYHQIAKRRT